MIKLIKNGIYLLGGDHILEDVKTTHAAELKALLSKYGIAQPPIAEGFDRREAAEGSIAAGIIGAHNKDGDPENLKIKFDVLASHDITYVGIIQTALASGLVEFPVPYVLTNCHNSLCAVGGTINEDDHVFGLSAARKFGGEFVPAHIAVIHQYVREMHAGCGKMILGSDSHTRYGALGTLAVGEGGPELVKQIVERTYDMPRPDIVAVYLKGSPRPGVGPQDVALAVIREVFETGFVKNSVMEFVGPGVSNLSVDFRIGIDVMTTETACWSSVWRTDELLKEYLAIHGRPRDYRKLDPAPLAWYDRAIVVELDKIKPMIALPFHPSNAYTIEELNSNLSEILHKVEDDCRNQIGGAVNFSLLKKAKDGRLHADQGIIAGCAGGAFENLVAASQILGGKDIGNGEFSLAIYAASQPVNIELLKNGCIEKLMAAGTTIRTAFCGPCFGAGDTPSNGALSIRHTTRNFPNREGSKPGEGQISMTALMDARSIAATAANGGAITPATEAASSLREIKYHFDGAVYEKRVYCGFGRPNPKEELIFGPNIKPWPKISPLPENYLLLVASVISDPVTTTDELIPSGETSSLRSNPLKLAEYALSRKDPGYVGRAKFAQEMEREKCVGKFADAISRILSYAGDRGAAAATGIGSVIFAVKPGDGSAREQAASSQKMLGGEANLAIEYATKRYRSNLINWGMIPFLVDASDRRKIELEDWLYIPKIRFAIDNAQTEIQAKLIKEDGTKTVDIELRLPGLAPEDRDIILAGCLMNYYANEKK
ncbi:MAG: hydratase [Holosporales bacterium]|jgi:aconitate hydratase|nr:hydratase [Holosporales bacterium]